MEKNKKLTIDGIEVTLGDRIEIPVLEEWKVEHTGPYGIYIVTDIGGKDKPYTLTRDAQENTAKERNNNTEER